ncbi:MAG: hypothetical protein LBH28_01160 [Oscillospiraceae bacterium]|jgi:hypothetical protein|nr:hypothetical protein [Oscillospiraceae bacterium]
MRVLFGNKKMKSGIIAVMIGVAILATSLSFAWWSSGGSGGTVTGPIDFGTVKADAFVSDFDVQTSWYPGLKQDGLLAGVQNLSTLEDVLIQVKFTVKATIKQDDKGNLVTPYTVTDPPYINIGLMEEGYEWPALTPPAVYAPGHPAAATNGGIAAHPLGLWFNDTYDAFYIWQKGTDDNYYVWAHNGNDELHLAWQYDIAWNLPQRYLNADIVISLDYIVVQGMPDQAVLETFGLNPDSFAFDYGFIDFDDGTGFPPFITGNTSGAGPDETLFGPFSLTNAVDNAIAKYSAMPDCGLKTLVLRYLTALQ